MGATELAFLKAVCDMHHSTCCKYRSELQAYILHLLIFDAQVLMALDDISQQFLLHLRLALHRKADDMFMQTQHASLYELSELLNI